MQLLNSFPTTVLVYSLLLLCILVQCVAGNVEKVIFTGPSAPSVKATTNPTLESLNINTLTHDDLSVRTNLSRIFASEQTDFRGQSSWLLLTNLTENQRYELRVCWSALVSTLETVILFHMNKVDGLCVVRAHTLNQEPTRFDMEAYTPDRVLENPKLLQSLNTYVASLQHDQGTRKTTKLPKSPSLLVEIHSAADYFTDNKELMANPSPVLVDLILDPFLFNVLPESLLPTVGYLGLLGIMTWIMARWVASGLRAAAGTAELPAKKRN
ncbi:GPI-Mannosyltransferase II co-activator domain-containing protein [Pochonia chlamydosporia 170]|uniref:GPI-Mannosyltransferase II co-activator domain-containing protein n=1 Tax=Pochonia chlamydosporia 170 TaxID=1380566 RepID=A0A179GA81_METCM|nr:GPI-Mannosyltransferase II co-activator domain-containing protein [Pochonia chlamydosporia 170]OAQ74321.1 GPI-Mannosyltransferase II co-activator domain-containing protein [Pochonia chlamydosporia 170]